MNPVEIQPEPSELITCPNCGAQVDPYAPRDHRVADVTALGEMRETFLVARCLLPAPPEAGR